MKNYIIPLIIALLAQLFLSNVLSIRGVKPDFIIIFMIYFALNQGSFRGVVTGFTLGLVISIFDSSPEIGVLPLTYSILGYGFGLLSNYKQQLASIKFNVYCYFLIFFSFFVYNYFLFDSIFYNDFSLFIIYWFKNMIYTVTLIVIFQLIFPFRK